MRSFSRVLAANGNSINAPAITVVGSGTATTSAGGAVMVLLSNVIAPFSASNRPSKSVAPVSAVIDARAKIFPSKAVVVPRVTELPICQKVLMPGVEELPSLIVTTELPDAVVRVEPIWKTKTASGLP